MKYRNIVPGIFLERVNRFIARVIVNGQEERVHVKNTGRGTELLLEGAEVFLEKSDSENRKTAYDLIAVKKGEILFNIDSQAPNAVAGEWLAAGGLYSDIKFLKPETTYEQSRFDFYLETESGIKAFVEVKGVTLEDDGVASFPDAPSERAVKHLRELMKAKQEGYETFLLFVVQMDGIHLMKPNREIHPEFAEALLEARNKGLHVIAMDCDVTPDSMAIRKPIEVQVGYLDNMWKPLLEWYDRGRRILPWREDPSPYHVWISEIMLQQTRVEAVKPYYDRFLENLPTLQGLADAPEDRLLKLWEGLGYYNRVRNLQKTAQIVCEENGGYLPDTYDELCKLPGIGSYTAGAIASIAYGKKNPAVDGNVLRVLARLTMDDRDTLSQKTKNAIEREVLCIMPDERPGDFNQAMMEIGATVCTPNGAPKCGICPLSQLCLAHKNGRELDFPVKAAKKQRRIEQMTVLLIQDDETFLLRKRTAKGLLAGLYEFPNLPGKKNNKEILEYLESIGIKSIRIKAAGSAKHIFSHVEWHMTGMDIRCDELENVRTIAENVGFIFADKRQMEELFPIPTAFSAFTKYLQIRQGTELISTKEA